MSVELWFADSSQGVPRLPRGVTPVWLQDSSHPFAPRRPSGAPGCFDEPTSQEMANLPVNGRPYKPSFLFHWVPLGEMIKILWFTQKWRQFFKFLKCAPCGWYPVWPSTWRIPVRACGNRGYEESVFLEILSGSPLHPQPQVMTLQNPLHLEAFQVSLPLRWLLHFTGVWYVSACICVCMRVCVNLHVCVSVCVHVWCLGGSVCTWSLCVHVVCDLVCLSV